MIAIVKYNAGNTRSVQNSISKLGYTSVVTDDKDLLLSADKVIFPGVGEAATAMAYLKETGLDQVIPQLTQPVLGICLGLQLMCTSTEEGQVDCLDIFNTQVKQFPKTDIVPHMGWNSIEIIKSSPLLDGIPNLADMYYVHSYYAEMNAHTVASCNYIQPFSAVLQKENFYACQFHPEKSSRIGEQLLKNFLEL